MHFAGRASGGLPILYLSLTGNHKYVYSRVMTEIPTCKCHGEPMVWNKDSSYSKAGGRWRCIIKKREYDRAYVRRHPEVNQRRNERRLRFGELYLGTCGFTESETKEILSGQTD